MNEAYRNASIRSGKMKAPDNPYKLDQKGLKILANGPKEGEEMPARSDQASLDGNLDDRRKRESIMKDLAQKISAEQEKRNVIEAKTAASILYNSPSLRSGNVASEAGEDVDDSTKSAEQLDAKDAATNKMDKEANEKMRKENKGNPKDVYVPPFDCAADRLSDQAAAWCTGRHLDGRPVATDGMIPV